MRRYFVLGVICLAVVIAGFLVAGPFRSVADTVPAPVASASAVPLENTRSRIKSQLDMLSFEERVRQLFFWSVPHTDISSEEARLLTTLQPGGVMLGGTMTSVDVLRLSTKIQQLKVPVHPLIAIDQEGGSVRRMTDDDLPSLASLSAQPELMCIRTRGSMRWLKELGVHVNFGVIADVAWTPDSYIADRAYGSDAETVSRVVETAIHCSEDVIATVKHFPGHGGTSQDSHVGVPVIDSAYESWKMSDAVPFRRAIQAGTPMMMTAHVVYPAVATEPATLSPRWYNELRSMGFTGAVITDDLSMMANPNTSVSSLAVQSFLAGADILLIVNPYGETEEDIVKAVTETIRLRGMQAQLDERVMRILELKYRAGLL